MSDYILNIKELTISEETASFLQHFQSMKNISQASKEALLELFKNIYAFKENSLFFEKKVEELQLILEKF